MRWTLNDYPSLMKNLNQTTKKKAIEIANFMIHEGHEEEHVIPIAIEQAKKWRNTARQNEIKQYEESVRSAKRSEKVNLDYSDD